MGWAGYVARMGRRGMHIGYWWESQKARPLRKPKHRWGNNIKIDFKKIEWVGSYLIDLAQDRDKWRALVNTVMNLRLP
jgi:hypothetical protein